MRCDVSVRLIVGLMVGVFLFSIMVAAPGGGAAEGQASAAEEPGGALYLTASRTNEPFLGTLHLFNPHYELVDAAPHGDDSKRAYMGLGSGADTHAPAVFSHHVASAFRLEGTVEVFLYIACDVATTRHRRSGRRCASIW